METNWDLLIENHFDKKETLAMDMLVEMVEQVMNENMGKSGEGTDLEKAVVAAWEGETPKHFEGFAPLSVADLRERYGLKGDAKMSENASTAEGWTGTDTTSKADIIIGDKNISMKMGPTAMLFGFGEGDATATMNAVIDEMYANLGHGPLTKEIDELSKALAAMKTTFVRGPKSALEKVKNLEGLPDDADAALRQIMSTSRNKYPEQDKLGQARDSIKADDEKLTRLVAIQTLDALKEHIETDLKEVNDRLKAVEDAAKAVFDVEANQNLEYAFYKYALTGQKKFKEGAEQIANSMLVTQDKKDLKKYTGKKSIKQLQVFYPEIDDNLIQQIANSASFRGKVRSDSAKKVVKKVVKKTGFYKLRESIVAEIKQIEGEVNEFLQKYEDLLNDDKLNEGVMDVFKNIFDKMTNWLSKSYDSLKKKFEALKDALAKAVDKGVDGLMDFFGIDKGELPNDVKMGEVFPELFI
jgi:hypothetical protein